MLILPTFYGAMLYHALEKARTHNYIKRYRGKPDPKTGKPRWVYVYHVAHQGGVHAEDHMVEGSAFKLGEGHYHITGRDGKTLTVRDDETGKTHTMTTDELAGRLKEHHKEALGKHKADAVRDLEIAKKNGVKGRALAHLEKRVAVHGALEEPKDESNGDWPDWLLSDEEVEEMKKKEKKQKEDIPKEKKVRISKIESFSELIVNSDITKVLTKYADEDVSRLGRREREQRFEDMKTELEDAVRQTSELFEQVKERLKGTKELKRLMNQIEVNDSALGGIGFVFEGDSEMYLQAVLTPEYFRFAHGNSQVLAKLAIDNAGRGLAGALASEPDMDESSNHYAAEKQKKNVVRFSEYAKIDKGVSKNGNTTYLLKVDEGEGAPLGLKRKFKERMDKMVRESKSGIGKEDVFFGYHYKNGERDGAPGYHFKTKEEAEKVIGKMKGHFDLTGEGAARSSEESLDKFKRSREDKDVTSEVQERWIDKVKGSESGYFTRVDNKAKLGAMIRAKRALTHGLGDNPSPRSIRERLEESKALLSRGGAVMKTEDLHALMESLNREGGDEQKYLARLLNRSIHSESGVSFINASGIHDLMSESKTKIKNNKSKGIIDEFLQNKSDLNEAMKVFEGLRGASQAFYDTLQMV